MTSNACPVEIDFGSRLLAMARLGLGFGSALPFTLLLWLLRACGSSSQAAFKRQYYRFICRIMGLQVEARGRLSEQHPTLFVANHASYLDIAILSSLLKASFVSKAEVRRWPVLGWSAAVQGTLFIDRRPERTKVHSDQITRHLQAGRNLILFPEGTSSDGNRVLPFKSALFAAAQVEVAGAPVSIQPVTIAYTRLDGLPLGRYLRPLFAWYGDMEFMHHFRQAMSLGIVTVAVEFHEPVTLAAFGSRKALSDHCQRVVAGGLSTALSGRRRQSLSANGSRKGLAGSEMIA